MTTDMAFNDGECKCDNIEYLCAGCVRAEMDYEASSH